MADPTYKLGKTVIALNVAGAPVHFGIEVTTPFGDMAQGSRHHVPFSASQDELQALATARGVTVDLFDELFASIAEYMRNEHAQAIDIPPKRVP